MSSKMFVAPGSGYARGAMQEQEKLNKAALDKTNAWEKQTAGLRNTLVSTLSNPSNLISTPNLSQFTLKKPATTDWTKAFVNPTGQVTLPHISMGGLSAFEQTPNWQEGGARAGQAYSDLADLNTQNLLEAKTGEVNQERARFGQNPMALPSSALSMWGAKTGAEARSKATLAQMDTEAALRREAADMSATKLELERQNQLDEENRFMNQYKLDAGFREEVNNNIARAAELAQMDLQLTNMATQGEATTRLAGSSARDQAMSEYLRLLLGISSPEAYSNIMSNLSNSYGNMAQTYMQTPNPWGDLLSLGAQYYGAKAGAKK